MPGLTNRDSFLDCEFYSDKISELPYTERKHQKTGKGMNSRHLPPKTSGFESLRS